MKDFYQWLEGNGYTPWGARRAAHEPSDDELLQNRRKRRVQHVLKLADDLDNAEMNMLLIQLQQRQGLGQRSVA